MSSSNSTWHVGQRLVLCDERIDVVVVEEAYTISHDSVRNLDVFPIGIKEVILTHCSPLVVTNLSLVNTKLQVFLTPRQCVVSLAEVAVSNIDTALKSLELCSYSIQISLFFRSKFTVNLHLVKYGIEELYVETVSGSTVGVTDDTQSDFLGFCQLILEHIVSVASRVQDKYFSSVTIEEELCSSILIRPRASPTSLVESHHTTLSSNTPEVCTGIQGSSQSSDVVPIARSLTLPLNLQGAVGSSSLM